MLSMLYLHHAHNNQPYPALSIQLCPQTMSEKDSNTSTSPPKTPPDTAEMSTSSSSSGSCQSCQRHHRCLRSAPSPSPEARCSRRHYHSPAPHSTTPTILSSMVLVDWNACPPCRTVPGPSSPLLHQLLRCPPLSL